MSEGLDQVLSTYQRLHRPEPATCSHLTGEETGVTQVRALAQGHRTRKASNAGMSVATEYKKRNLRGDRTASPGREELSPVLPGQEGRTGPCCAGGVPRPKGKILPQQVCPQH